MAEPSQGDIWWADLPQPAGRRPVLILTRTDSLPRLANVTVAPLTRTILYIDTEVVLSPDDGVPSLCAISLDNILTIPKVLLDRRITSVDDDRMREVFDAIASAFAMPRRSTPTNERE